ncbi:MAG: DMT family transporter [Rhodocyclaceae bacterium]|nr:DMT family transporter [Rhodocyclaceae bacterium]MBP6279759.1 DMT family transporter [Rhodocyclaceae bacterium]
MTESERRIGLALAGVAAFGFSFKAILIKLAYPYGVDAVTLLALRMSFALPIFLYVGFTASRSAPPLLRRDWGMVIVLGLFGYYGASILDFLGLQYVSAGLERLILFTYPTLTMLFGVVLHGTKITRREWTAIALCYGGIAIAFTHDLRLSGDVTATLIGAGFVFASSVCYAIYLTGSGGMIARIGAARFTALAMLVSTFATLAHFLAVQPVARLTQPWPVYAYALAMAIFCTAVPVFAQSAAIRRIGSGRAAMIGMIGPLLTIAFAALLLSEGLSAAQMLGAALVIAGITVVSRK